jgi:ATP-dependent Lhr-like helicase
VQHSDDGVVVQLQAGTAELPLRSLLPRAEELEAVIAGELQHSSLFAARFRENAARALLFPRRRPGTRAPLYLQRLRAQALL